MAVLRQASRPLRRSWNFRQTASPLPEGHPSVTGLPESPTVASIVAADGAFAQRKPSRGYQVRGWSELEGRGRWHCRGVEDRGLVKRIFAGRE